MRLGDLDALIAEYDRVHIGPPGGARKLMEEAPTIDPEELRPKGRWVRVDHYPPYCSNCEGIAPKDCEGEGFYDSDYCPSCGAKMDEGNADD